MKYLVDKECVLEKFSGKGAWTYTLIPEISQNKNNPFGWARVSGFIDDFAINNYKLMPYGNGELFLPLNAKLRKTIKKEAGDKIRVRLNVFEIPKELPVEILECLEDESKDLINQFYSLPEKEQNIYLTKIFDSKTEQIKTQNILELIGRLT